MKTLKLGPTWDLTLDAGRNLAIVDGGYALAQDAGSSIKTFRDECYYDTARGVPYWWRQNWAAPGQILGAAPPTNYMEAKFAQAAKLVPGVTAARAKVASVLNRVVTGTVHVTDKEGVTTSINF